MKSPVPPLQLCFTEVRYDHLFEVKSKVSLVLVFIDHDRKFRKEQSKKLNYITIVYMVQYRALHIGGSTRP